MVLLKSSLAAGSVVIEKLTHYWPAFKKWNLEYIKKVAVDKTVPMYEDRIVKNDVACNEARAVMKRSEYIDLIDEKLTHFRIFLYNILNKTSALSRL
jgi:hypothetical protein